MSASPSVWARPPAVWVPDGAPELADAVGSGGGRPEPDPAKADAIVWVSKDVDGLVSLLHPRLRWVQLPDAGVERWLAAGVEAEGRVVTTARGCYGPQVAEHALALLLAAVRRIPECSRLTRWPAERPVGTTLAGADVAVLGAGGIGSALAGMLTALGARAHCVSRSGAAVATASTSRPVGELDGLLGEVDHVVLALPSTPGTRRIIGADRLRLMRSSAWLVNVGRGDLVDTHDLLAALEDGEIAGAALDVTDPEPLPTGHPLWACDRVLVTPHVANPPALKARALAGRVEDNTRRLAAGLPLAGSLGDDGY